MAEQSNSSPVSKYWWLAVATFLLFSGWTWFSESSWFSRISPNRISVNNNRFSVVLPPKWMTLPLKEGRETALIPMNSGETYKAAGGAIEVAVESSLDNLASAIRLMASLKSYSLSEESTFTMRGTPVYHCTYLWQRDGENMISELWAVPGFDNTVYCLTLTAKAIHYEKCKPVFKECAESISISP